MKKLNIKYFSILALVFMVGCEAPTVGYNTYEWGKDYKYSLGSEESIEIAMAFDKAWYDRDFEKMRLSKKVLSDLSNRCYIARNKVELLDFLKRYKDGKLPTKWSESFIDNYIFVYSILPSLLPFLLSSLLIKY